MIFKRLRNVVTIDEMQIDGFMPGRGTADAIFILRQILEKFEMTGRILHVVFVDLEKPFHRVPRGAIWWALRKKGVIEIEVLAITEKYKNITTSARIDGERSEEFKVKVEVHQVPVSSPLFFLQ